MYADLLSQAELLARKEPRRPRQASLRRAVSSAYYALFHFLVGEVSRFLTRRVAQSFLDLQEARHTADYDLSRTFTKRAAEDLVEQVRRAFDAWRRVRKEPVARAFLICLLSYNRLTRR